METNTNSVGRSEDPRAAVGARLAQGETPGDVAAALGLRVTADDHDHGAPVVVLPGWIADDGNAEVECPDAPSGGAAAREYVQDGDWGDRRSTTWVHVWAWQVGLGLDDEGAVVEVQVGRDSHTVTLDPDVPACADGREHDWCSPHSVLGGVEENPGVQGNGGGAICREVCRHCGCYRVTDTWAQDWATGEQGLRSVEYQDADEPSLVWVAREDAATGWHLTVSRA